MLKSKPKALKSAEDWDEIDEYVKLVIVKRLDFDALEGDVTLLWERADA